MKSNVNPLLYFDNSFPLIDTWKIFLKSSPLFSHGDTFSGTYCEEKTYPEELNRHHFFF